MVFYVLLAASLKIYLIQKHDGDQSKLKTIYDEKAQSIKFMYSISIAIVDLKLQE